MLLNDIQPSFFPSANRVIVIGDVHGDVHTFMRCLYAMRIFNQNLEWVAEPKDTIVVQLGDQLDAMSRGGSDTWEVFPDVEMVYLSDKLDQIARMHGGRVLSLLGNHELMNVLGDFSYVSPQSLQKIDHDTRLHMFRPGGTIANILAKRNLVLKIGPYLFCHGGIMPHHLMVAKNLHKMNDVTRKYLRNIPLNIEEQTILNMCVLHIQSVVWTRMYIELFQANKEMLEEAINTVLHDTDSRHIIVGHNTVDSVTSIYNGKVIFTDVGLSRAFPGDTIQVVELIQNEIRTHTITS